MRADRGRPRRSSACAVALVAVIALGAACGDDDSSDDTLVPLDGPAGTSGAGVAPTGDITATDDTTVDPSVAGAGFVSIQVRLPAAGVDETLSLDRATVRADALDPVSLDASCTALDGGEGLTVAVVDMRRLGAGSRVVSAALRVDGTPTAGPNDATIDVSDADLVTTAYAGTVELADGGWSGTFEAADPSGAAVSGAFVCADAPVATTTAPPQGGGEEVPATEAPDGG